DPHLKPIPRANEPPLRRKVASGFDSLVAACVNPAITPMASIRTTIFLTWFIVYLLLVLLSCRKINKDFCAAASALLNEDRICQVTSGLVTRHTMNGYLALRCVRCLPGWEWD